MENSKNQTCCFKGHRRLPQEKIEQIMMRLNQEVDNLINQGVKDFISGGAIGFDMVAAALIVAKKEMGNDIRLIFALPCKNQDKPWNYREKKLYHGLLSEADDIIYVSEEYTDDCMEKRNRYMVDRSAYCICALLNMISGTGQTVRYAKKMGVKVIHI